MGAAPNVAPLRVVRLLALASLALLILAPGPRPLDAQEQQPPAEQRPEAEPADVESPEAIVTAAYDVISGAANEERDWDRFRSLMLPQARLIPTGRPEGRPSRTVLTTEEFIENARNVWIRDDDFYERGIHAVTERYGDIAHVFSTYESLRSPDGEPFSRGINSFQLWFDGDRWWIVTIFWHAEREGAPIPERYGG